MFLEKRLKDMTILLNMKRYPQNYEAVVSIPKASGEPPIFSDTLAVLLETEEGKLLRATEQLRRDYLLEFGSAYGSTASAHYIFPAQEEDAKVERAVVVLRGDWVEFDFSPPL